MFIVCHTVRWEGSMVAICVRLYDQFWNVSWSPDCLVNHSTTIKMEKKSKRSMKLWSLSWSAKVGQREILNACLFLFYRHRINLARQRIQGYFLSYFDRLLWLINLIIPKGNWFSVVESQTIKTTKDIVHTWQKTCIHGFIPAEGKEYSDKPLI